MLLLAAAGGATPAFPQSDAPATDWPLYRTDECSGELPRPYGLIGCLRLENEGGIKPKPGRAGARSWHLHATLPKLAAGAARPARDRRNGWLTIQVLYRLRKEAALGEHAVPGQGGHRLALWVNGYASSYRDSVAGSPGYRRFAHAVSVPISLLARQGGEIDMLLSAQAWAHDGAQSELVVEELRAVCAAEACGPDA